MLYCTKKNILLHFYKNVAFYNSIKTNKSNKMRDYLKLMNPVNNNNVIIEIAMLWPRMMGMAQVFFQSKPVLIQL